jgi:hypothetical protein
MNNKSNKKLFIKTNNIYKNIDGINIIKKDKKFKKLQIIADNIDKTLKKEMKNNRKINKKKTFRKKINNKSKNTVRGKLNIENAIKLNILKIGDIFSISVRGLGHVSCEINEDGEISTVYPQ